MSRRISKDFNHNSEFELSDNNLEKTVDKQKICDAAQKKKSCFKLRPFRGFGIICVLLSSCFYSTMSLIVKLVDSQHPMQLVVIRAAVQFLILLPLIQYKHKKVDILGPKGLKKYLWLQGAIGASGTIFIYLAIKELTLGNAVTISYFNLILVPFMARIFLKESLTYFDVIFALMSLSGIILIARPTFLFPVSDGEKPPTSGLGVLYGILGALCKAGVMITLRKLGKHSYAALNMIYYSIIAVVASTVLLFALHEFRFPCTQDLPYMFSMGIIGILGQYLLYVAIQYERAGTISVMKSSQIIIVYVLQVTVLGEIPSTLSLIGAVLVFSSSIGIGVRKIVNEGKRRRSIAKSNSIAKK